MIIEAGKSYLNGNGDIVDVRGDKGMDGAGVAALADDCLAYAFRTIGV